MDPSDRIPPVHLDGVIPPMASQADVYETVGKPVVEGVLNGYNGAILAYG